MLLRSLTKHVTDQNWFAVFIDFLIVVVGVFIGIQVNTWNQNLNDKSDSNKYLQRLANDVKYSIGANRNQISSSEKNIKQLDLVLKALEKCTLNKSDEPVFAAGIYNMGKYNLPEMVMSTIDELNSTGKFSILGDAELRKQIIETVRAREKILAIDTQISARIIPSINYVRSRFRFKVDTHLHYPESIDPINVQYNFATLCEDNQLINAIAIVRELTLAVIFLNQRIYRNQESLLKALEEKIQAPSNRNESE